MGSLFLSRQCASFGFRLLGLAFGLQAGAVKICAHRDTLVIGHGFVVFQVVTGWLGHD